MFDLAQTTSETGNLPAGGMVSEGDVLTFRGFLELKRASLGLSSVVLDTHRRFCKTSVILEPSKNVLVVQY